MDDPGAGEDGQPQDDPVDLSAGLGVAVVESRWAMTQAMIRKAPAQPTTRLMAAAF
ncbi:MAG: hypothetical protein ACREJV_00850 [Candidatus Rokuibacteriota bacterium]